MEQCFHANKEIGELQKLQLHKQQKAGDKYQNISARVNTSLREKKQEDTNSLANDTSKQQPQTLHQKISAPVLDKKQIVPIKKVNRSPINNNILNKQKKKEHCGTNKRKELQKKFLSDPNVSQKDTDSIKNNDDTPVTYKSRGIQTLDTKQIDALYAEGIIRYPRRNTNPEVMDKVTSVQRPEEISRDVPDSVNRENVSIPEIVQDGGFKNSESPPPQEATDFIKQNKERISIASKIATQLNNGVPPANYRKGVVPKYIRDRKEAHEKEQKAKAAASHPDCPEGHVPLPDNERKETLRMLKKNYQDYINELNMMPIKTDTLRAQRRKMEIEKQLNKLEEGIKVFSRPKVYVKVNA